MIALREDCLLVEQAGGGYLPCSAEELTFEVVGDTSLVDGEVLKHATAAVMHYFREELDRTTVTLGEFSAMLTKVLQGLGISAEVTGQIVPGEQVRIADLGALAEAGGIAGELEFCQRLRTLLREQLAAAPSRLEILGLRVCVKRLTGRKHWCPTCERTAAWILEMIRGWYAQEAPSRPTALVVR
jgi:hypothetical protein